MVERHYLKGLAAVAAAYGCEFCVARACTAGKGVQWLYPETAGKPERKGEEMKVIARYENTLVLHSFKIHFTPS